VALAVGGRYAKCPVDGAVAAEEPAHSADTNALLGTVSLLPVGSAVDDFLLDETSLLRLRVFQPGMKNSFFLENLIVELFGKKLKEFQLQRQEMAHVENG